MRRLLIALILGGLFIQAGCSSEAPTPASTNAPEPGKKFESPLKKTKN